MNIRRHHIHVGDTVFYQGAPRSQPEWEEAMKQLVREGRFLEAYDFSKTALEQFPNSTVLRQVAARSALRTGGTEEALNLLRPLCPRFFPDQQAIESFPEEETLGNLASALKRKWAQSPETEDLHVCRDVYLQAFERIGGYWTGINAATMSWILGDRNKARELAAQVLSKCDAALPSARGDDEYWIPATMGEAYLLLGKKAKTKQSYKQAMEKAAGKWDYVVASRAQLRLMREHGFPLPKDLLDIVKLPAVVVFVGHMIDNPNRKTPRFPPEMEACVRDALDEKLEELKAGIGFSSAACGSDLLFIEAMQDRDAEVNIVLPFDEEDFIQTSVAHAGERWVRRFRRALKLAASVKYVTKEPYLNHDLLFRFGAQVFCGYAEVRAQRLETDSHLVAVCDEISSGCVGGTADIANRWPEGDRKHVIRIDQLPRPSAVCLSRGAIPATASTVAPTNTDSDKAGERVIKTLLFADIVGYSKLEEQETPFFLYEFLEKVARQLPGRPECINTWGDAIFCVMSDAASLLEYAFALQEVVCNTEWKPGERHLAMSIRIALHAGPVLQAVDPITGRENFYGAHVNRGARLEPVTPKGDIFATEQFLALLVSEQNSGSLAQPFDFEYAGTIGLAKDFGEQAVYCLRKRPPREPGVKRLPETI